MRWVMVPLAMSMEWVLQVMQRVMPMGRVLHVM